MNKFKRVFLIVMDSAGVGHDSDAPKFGDHTNPNTFLHIDEYVNGLKAPTLEYLGFGDFDNYKYIKKVDHKNSYTTRLHETSNGKDTMTGHWEMMGVNTQKAFKTFTDTGFPKELLDEITKQTGYELMGNIAASGTEIIKQMGEEHMKTNKLIVYTSADSVLQVAAHEEIVPVKKLYEICDKIRQITLKEEWKVGRIIARPFIGTCANDFTRTPNRHDYALSPSNKTHLEYLKDAGYDCISVGKIYDIFNTSGLTESNRTVSNHHGMEVTTKIAERDFEGICFVNLVDFDAAYGHRRNPKGYGEAIEEFDKDVKVLMDKLTDEDLLIITADHGNDPTAPGTDHTREQVPGVFYSKAFKEGKYLGVQDTFAVLGATTCDNFDVKFGKDLIGYSLLDQLK